MRNYIIAVVSSAKANFFRLELADFPEDEDNPKLIEVEKLQNSNQELQGQDLWSNVKPGRNRSTTGQVHGYDDHRENHRVEFGRRFAQEIAATLFQIIKTSQPCHLLLVAEPKILGIMRETLVPDLPKNLAFSELTKDLCHLNAYKLQEYLTTKDLLPAPSRQA
ncbi:MAG TPA: host attachment protein [Chroococcidiopsis sp.]